ncbi:glycosyltransferase family 2 protein [Candidatus Roizmanbacteria bacterium]|nr:glycosyltransferase family 2 protein [Candidatus Roizmanbacteria bacterium]
MNTQNPTISVVVVAYNEEKYIPKTLESIQKQTYKDYELIVVDNNSVDKTNVLAKQYGARVLNEKTQGYVYALNTGLRATKGRIIAVSDADTIVPSDWLEKIAKEFEDPQLLGLTGSLRYNTRNSFSNWLIYKSYDLFIMCNFLLGKAHFTGTCIAFRKAVFQKIGNLNVKFKVGADVDLGLQIQKFGKVSYTPHITVIASDRRWKQGILDNFLKYVQAYLYVVWLRREVKSSLKPTT